MLLIILLLAFCYYMPQQGLATPITTLAPCIPPVIQNNSHYVLVSCDAASELKIFFKQNLYYSNVTVMVLLPNATVIFNVLNGARLMNCTFAAEAAKVSLSMSDRSTMTDTGAHFCLTAPIRLDLVLDGKGHP